VLGLHGEGYQLARGGIPAQVTRAHDEHFKTFPYCLALLQITISDKLTKVITTQFQKTDMHFLKLTVNSELLNSNSIKSYLPVRLSI